MNHYDFADRIAVVTGGGQGIGRTVAERILQGGGGVSIWDRDADLLGRTVAELGERAQACRSTSPTSRRSSGPPATCCDASAGSTC